MKSKVKAKDYNRGKKRVNLSLDIYDYEDLVLIANSKGIVQPGTVALMILLQETRKQAAALRKAGELPGQQHLFNAVKIKTKGKRIS